MNLFRRVFLVFLISVFSLTALAERDALEGSWEAIQAEALREGKYLYVVFLGDGWSMACKRMEEDILQSDAFLEIAEERLLYCTVRARVQPKLPSKKVAALQSLVIHFDIKSYPTAILLAPDGQEIIRHGYRTESPDEYVALLTSILPAAAKAKTAELP